MAEDAVLRERKEEVSEIIPTSVTQGKTWRGDENNFTAAHAVDRDFSTLAITHTENEAGWMKLEFGKTLFIHKIVIYGRFYTNWYHPNDWCVKKQANFKICMKDCSNVDVSVYRGEVKQKSCGTLKLTIGLGQSDQIYILACNTKGDTVKLNKTTYNAIAVSEVSVTGTGTNNN
ncbi:hypothetical protein ACHWQZ_G018969 [Mnemiopsis leidyi]